MDRPVVQELVGGRLHLQHGPIDIVLEAWGAPADRAAAYDAAIRRFRNILGELVAELGELRKPMSERPRLRSPVGRRMAAACQPFADVFITPMAAVAGAVADEIKSAMLTAAPLDRLYVNDGGDIAVHLAAGESMALGIAGDFLRGPQPRINGTILLTAAMGIGGIATSGWQGRSFSLGIADSVTVLAADAAAADAAATLIANAVDVDSGNVRRRPAIELDPDTDLGHRLVTVGVGPLSRSEIAAGLAAGARVAECFRKRGLITGAALMLQGEARTLGMPLARLPAAVATKVAFTARRAVP